MNNEQQSDAAKREAILNNAKAASVRYVRLQFTDLMGRLKNVEVPVHELPKVLDNEVMFDGSSIDGFARIDESDMFLRPDLNTWLVFPWSTPQGTIARLLCDVYLPDGTAFAGDPRGILKRTLQHMQQLGFQDFNVGLEVEFFLLRTDRAGRPILSPNDEGGYFDISPLDSGENCRHDITIALRSMGIGVEASHHEVAPGQHEIDLQYVGALAAADNLMTMRMLVKTIAREHGLHATFMPKPFAHVDGSGLHVHQSLSRRGNLGDVNAFSDKTRSYQLSTVAEQYIAGLLQHAPAVSAITNPVVNSYKRMVPGYDAPLYSAWSDMSPNAYVRVPQSKGQSTRVEVRAPDSASNPYLAFAAMLEAGLDGVQSELELHGPVEQKLNNLSEMERFHLGVHSLPQTLEQALIALEEDQLIQGVLGPHAYRLFERVKWQEWSTYQRTVHAWERDAYLDL